MGLSHKHERCYNRNITEGEPDDRNPTEEFMMYDRIVIDPAIQHGKPLLRGTRVPVVRILG